MQNSRRDFVKKAAIVTAGTVAGATVLTASSETHEQSASNNGVVKGSSRNREILYKKTAAWEEFYKNAK